MPGGSQEANVLRTYIETVLEMPWKKTSRDNQDIIHAKEVLEEDHYGLEQVKDRVLEFLAVRALTKKGTSPILCLVGCLLYTSDMKTMEVLRLPKEMMDGQKWNAFVLGLSFLGWQLLGTLLCGIGTFFVQPYVAATFAGLYACLLYTSITR